MNGINKTVVGVVFGIALIYAILSLALTLDNLLSTGDVSMFIFLPTDNGPGLDLGEYIGPMIGMYDGFLSLIGSGYVKLAFIVLGFAISIAGMVLGPSLDLKGSKNPAEYLWTQRPNAFIRCIAAPWGLFGYAAGKNKLLVALPAALLPFYIPWSAMISVFLILPFIVTKIVMSSVISKASKKERDAYGSEIRFAICPVCKRNFERPKVRCRCGLVLDYPVPNEYGFKYHTCNNGHRIPCTAGKRDGLSTVCPHCGADIQTREAKPISISLVGAVGSGKTTLMLATVKTVSKAARGRDVTVDTVTQGISKGALAAKDVAPRTAPGEVESECFFIGCRDLKYREIVFNDISGQEFEPREDKVLFEEYYNYTDGIIFVFDPKVLSMASSRSQTPTEVFCSFQYMFNQIRNTGPSTVTNIPFAVVAAKNDVMSPMLRDSDVRDFLIRNGEEAFVKNAESVFSDVRYFAVSSVGDDCESAAGPVWWIVGRCDPELERAVPIGPD